MNWFFNRIVKRFFAERIRRAYQRNLREAYLFASTVRSKASESAQQILSTAESEARRVKSRATEAAKDIEDQARTRGRETGRKSAERAATQERAAARAEGERLGRIAAFTQAAHELGLAEPFSEEAVEIMPMTVNIDRIRPNIYKADGAWIVRVIVNGQLNRQYFEHTSQANAVVTLVQAVRYRDTLAPVSQSKHAALYRECHEQAVGEFGTNGELAMIRTCELFHLRVQRTDLELDRVAFAGEDPEDRLNIEDKSILVEPWTMLFEKLSARTVKAFANIGLTEDRTVRDLLLLEAEELLNAGGFGPAALQKLNDGLAEHGLALWGEATAPRAPRDVPTDGSRNFRAIDLD